MKINIYKIAIIFFIIQSLLIVLLLNNNYMKEYSFLQSSYDLVELFLGLVILGLNLAAIVIVRHLYRSGLEAERLKITALKQVHMEEQQRLYRLHHHDLRNHLSVILGLLQLGKKEELQNYLKTYLNSVNDALLKVETGLAELDVLLSSKLQLAKNNDIQVELTVTTRIQSNKRHIIDLVTILGNVLNNTLEAVQDLEKAQRKMKITIDEDRLDYIFEVMNPTLSASVDNNPEQYFKEGFSTKSKDRGQGLFIVKRMTKRLDGNVSIDTADGKFTVTITIPKFRLEEE